MLSVKKIEAAKAKGKPYKLTDRDGLYLYVSTTGARSWRYDYRIAGKRETLTIGQCPDVSLTSARKDLAEARELVAKGESPALAKRRDNQTAKDAREQTFRAEGERWFTKYSPVRSESWKGNCRRWLDRHVYPRIGGRPLEEVTAADIKAVMRAMSDKPKSAEYARQMIAQVFRFAISNDRALHNPAREIRAVDIVEMPEPVRRAKLSANDIAPFFEALDRYQGKLQTKFAAKLLLLTFVRKSELIEAKAKEFDLDNATWTIPAERMKAGKEHIVPLSRQAVACIRECVTLAMGYEYLFPNHGAIDKPMAASTLNMVFHKIKFGWFTPHGIRTTASTTLNESGFRADVIERQLAHTERDRVRDAYNHADYLPERRAMMQHWADYLESIAAGGKVVPIRKAS